MKLSIIIPVYKVEKYISKCLESCLKQDLKKDEYEIILVDDGCPDNSLDVVADLIRANENIKVVTQINKGLSAARNAGLKLARGSYVWFVDSDDWIEANCLKEIVSNCRENDILAINFIKVFENGEFGIVEGVESSGLGKDVLENKFIPQAQMYVFNRDFLNGNKLRFYEGVFHEDLEFTPRAIYLANEIKILNKVIYYFLQRTNSITRCINPQKGFDLLKVSDSLNNFRLQKVNIESHTIFIDLISLAINSAFHNGAQMSGVNVKTFSNEIKMRKSLLKLMMKSSKMFYKLEGYLFLLPINKISIYRILKLIQRTALK